MDSFLWCARRRAHGFTILELLLVCAMTAILATWVAPAFEDYVRNARRTAQVNNLLHALHAARSSAIRLGEAVVLCKSASGEQCTPEAGGWSEGWIVFANLDRDFPPARDAGEPLLLRQPHIEGLSIHANRAALVYWPVSLAGTPTSFVFCDPRGAASARAIIVSQTGRPRTADRDSAGRPLRCAGGS